MSGETPRIGSDSATAASSRAGHFRRIAWPGRQEEYDRALEHFLSGDAGRGARAFHGLLGRTDELANPADRALFRVQAAHCLIGHGEWRRAEHVLDLASEESQRSSDIHVQAHVLCARANVEFVRQNIPALAELAQRAKAILVSRRGAYRPGPFPDTGAASLLTCTGMLHSARGESVSALQAHRLALSFVRSADPRLRLYHTHFVVNALFLAERKSRAAALARRCRTRALSLRPPWRALDAWASDIASATGDDEARIVEILHALRLYRTLGIRVIAEHRTNELAYFCLNAGWPSTAWRLGEKIGRAIRRLEMAQDFDAEIRRPLAAEIAIELGLTRNMSAIAADLERELQTKRDRMALQVTWSQLCRIALARDDRAAVRRYARSGIRAIHSLPGDPAVHQWYQIRLLQHILWLADVEVADGRFQEARKLLASLGGLGLRRAHPAIRARVDLLEAELLLAEQDSAETARRRAVRGWTQARQWMPPEGQVHALSVMVRCLIAAGRDGEARRWALACRRLLATWVEKLLPSHRRSVLRKPKLRSAMEALRAAGVDPDPSRAKEETEDPPVRMPRMERLERAWQRLHASGLVQTGRTSGLVEEQRRFRRRRVMKALRTADWNVSAAARALRIDRCSLHRLIRNLGLRKP